MQIDKLKETLESTRYTVLENEPMSKHTSFKIGGPAKLFVSPADSNALSELITNCKNYDIPTVYFGNGSNILFNDYGFDGVVISTSRMTEISLQDENIIECGSGVKNSVLCQFALENSLSGFEFLWGIPGTVGGAAFMNAGAYGGEIKDVIVGCEYITADGEIKEMSSDEMDLSYRHSIFSENGGIITKVKLRGKLDNKEVIRALMDELMDRRRTKQPLEFPSAGSVFKRPEGYFAAALIEECGLKGESVGGAQVSEKHSGFIINTGNATASDVKQLVEIIKETVFMQKGVQLECEIRVI
ncbi:MAG: UDP-N-acetylmuramate dehydrogenase [Acutalibacteraceae bacterium]|nr:UDP-N-acetylmuramate dehydrogenase [Acutalibacteraceae bacterium]